jgi:hypothetical protein
MILEMRKSQSSTKLNSLQQAERILLKQNALKMRGFSRNRTNRLGLSGSALPRIFRFNNLKNLTC